MTVVVPPTLVCLVTGCSSPKGIGFATARALARAGHTVVATVRDLGTAPRLAEDVDGSIAIRRLDLLDPRTGAEAVQATLAAEGRLDVLVNNAGYGIIGAIEQVTIEQARANLETNFLGTMALVQEVLPIMRRQGSGHVVNVSSVFVAGVSLPGAGFYIASKAALESACQALAVEVAPWNVRVTNLQPGPVGTELHREWGDRVAEGGDPRPTMSDELYSWVVDGDAPAVETPEGVAAAIVALVTEAAPPVGRQTASTSRAYAAETLRDPGRMAELERMLRAFPSSI